MSKYILSIDSLITTFEFVDSLRPIKFKLDSRLNNESLKVIEKGDTIVINYIEPLDGVLSIWIVENIDLSKEELILKKKLEISTPVNIKSILSEDEANKIMVPSNLFKIEDEKYSKIFNLILLSLGNQICEEQENYVSDPILNKNENYIQRILFGSPGTGKSYNVTKLIKDEQNKNGILKNIGDNYIDELVFRTTIHPEYNYYDFVGSTMPNVKENGEITYEFKPGIFTLALAKALKTEKQVYLVIEEMSRGNISAIFGDLFQLLDRDIYGVSEYKIDNDLVTKHIIEEEKIKLDKLYLPGNLNIIGTVNTSDQNVFVMDNAFKRRFEFEYIDIKPVKNINGEYLNDFNFTLEDSVSRTKLEFNWIDFYQSINHFIINNLELPEDKQIGQFFIQFKDSDDHDILNSYNFAQLKNKLLLYLWEDIHSINLSSDKLFSEIYSKSFSKTYDSFSKGIYVFSQKFLDTYNMIKDIE